MSPGQPTPASSVPPQEGERARELERIFREHNDALVRFVAARLGSRHEAAEVAQEAYVKVLSLEEGEAVSYLRAFLFKIAANLATDRLRARSRRGWTAEGSPAERAVFELSPEREIAGKQSLERLRKAIDELPTKCREAFLLYRIEDLSCAEIAARMGLQERMVWRYIARALEYIRGELSS
jgi:RNA polymerase sigma-70 factor (ECF subfamily)